MCPVSQASMNQPQPMTYSLIQQQPTSQQHNVLINSSGQVVGLSSPGSSPGGSSITRLKGLHYDTVPRKLDGPSEAEKKLAALTQQLEQDMQISRGPIINNAMTTQQPITTISIPVQHIMSNSNNTVRRLSNASSTASGSAVMVPVADVKMSPPPPYPGYHHSIPVSLQFSTTSSSNQLSPALSNLSSPTSTKSSSITTTPLKTQLPMQVSAQRLYSSV